MKIKKVNLVKELMTKNKEIKILKEIINEYEYAINELELAIKTADSRALHLNKALYYSNKKSIEYKKLIKYLENQLEIKRG